MGGLSRGRHVRSAKAPRRPRARHVVAGALAAWALVATVVPLVHALPPALRTATIVRRLHTDLGPLGSGWTGLLEMPSSTGPLSDPSGWEWSRGATSTIRIPSGWRALSLEMSPIPCRDRKPQKVFLAGSGTLGPTLTLLAGFHWYQVPLGWLHGGNVLTLSYRCVVIPLLRAGHRSLQRLAVAVADVRAVGTE